MTRTYIATLLLSALISGTLTVHDENELHKHRYDPDTGRLANTDYYDITTGKID